MIAELRAGCLLLMSLAFFLIIIALLAPGMVMKPDRWSERIRLATEVRSAARNGIFE